MSQYIPKAGEFCWNELMTPDTAKAKSFYCDFLGWSVEDIDMGDMVYSMFKSGDKEVCGMLQTPKGQEDQIPPHWMSYIMVDDVEAMVKKAEQLGANIMVPVQTINDIGRFAVIVDPTGAHVAIWQSLKEC